MSVVDYSQTAEDHQCFLVLVRPTGKLLSGKHFSRCWERIVQLNCVAIPGQKRVMWIRYKRQYSAESNEWGDFQVHRKALGLISVGRCSNEAEFQDLFESYKKEKECYADSLYNSRLIVFGMNRDGSEIQRTDSKIGGDDSPPPTFKMDSFDLESSDSDSVVPERLDGDAESEYRKGTVEVLDPLQFDQRECDTKADSEVPIVVKNSPIVNNNNNNKKEDSASPQITFIRTKSEKADNKKVENKKLDNLKKPPVKRTGSNNSLRDAPGSEVVFYPSVDNCEGLEEGLKDFVTSLFFVLEGKRLDRGFEKGDRSMLLRAPFEKKDFVGLDTDTKSFKKKCQGRLRKHLADLCLIAGMPGEAMLHYTTALDLLKPVNDNLWMAACYEGLCSTAVITQFGTQAGSQSTLRRNQSFSTKRGVASLDKQKPGLQHSYANGFQDLAEASVKSNLDADDITEKYKEALMYYSKYKNAAVVEMEASLKACRILILLKRPLAAADFLQNVIYINLQLSDEDRISRYSTLSSLYGQIGFQRKASFFKRVAAMQCVAPQNPRPNWAQCHHLLVQALAGYRIHLDPKDTHAVPGEMNGWTVIQTRVLHELIYSAKRMGNLQLAVRYLTILLHTQLDYLSDSEKRELVTNLEGFTGSCEGTVNTLALDSGVLVPHVPLINVPRVKTFKLLPLATHLEPRNLRAPEASASDSVFIFTPLNIGAVEHMADRPEVDFKWVEGDLCEVELVMCNPMPDALPLSQLSLLTEGVAVETFPSSVVLPVAPSLYRAKITMRPTAAGELSIVGYHTKLYGVRSNCKLRDCPSIPQSLFKIVVTSALPQAHLSTSLSCSADFLSFGEGLNVVTSATAVLYCGQSKECTVTIQNKSRLPIDWVKVSLEATRDSKDCVNEVYMWNSENVQSQLPIPPSGVLCFTMVLQGIGDFLIPGVGKGGRDSLRRLGEPVNQPDSLEGRVVEGVLRVDYSGGPGYHDNLCRCSSVAFSVDILPSVVFTKWNVMLSESSDHCYVILDLKNVCDHDTEVRYSGQSAYLKHQHIRSICIEVERLEPGLVDSHTDAQFSSLLASFLDITYTIPSQKVSGKVDASRLTWTKEQQQLLCLSPVSWDIHLNGQVISPLHIGSLEYRTGQLIRLDVEATIQSETSELFGRGAVLTLCCCQHHDNGVVSYDTDQYVIAMGNQDLHVEQISSDTPVHHSCTYMFTCAGFYKFDIQLRVGSGETQSDINYGNGGQGNTRVNSVQGHGHSYTVKDEGQDSKPLLLKCLSVIEVNIVE